MKKVYAIIVALVVSIITLDTMAQDCVSFNPNTTKVERIQNDWKIVDGNHWMFSFVNNECEARMALMIIKFYKMNQSCFVGRPNPSFTYMLTNGNAPTGELGGEDCISFNPNTAQVRRIRNDWKIVDGNHLIFSFGNKENEAREALQIIRRYGFNKTCYVGRPDPSFSYLRK